MTDTMDHYRACKWPACQQKLRDWEELDAMLRSPRLVYEQIAQKFGIWIDGINGTGKEGAWLRRANATAEFDTEKAAHDRICTLPMQFSYSVRRLP